MHDTSNQISWYTDGTLVFRSTDGSSQDRMLFNIWILENLWTMNSIILLSLAVLPPVTGPRCGLYFRGDIYNASPI